MRIRPSLLLRRVRVQIFFISRGRGGSSMCFVAVVEVGCSCAMVVLVVAEPVHVLSHHRQFGWSFVAAKE